MLTIVTHHAPDLDAITSVWLLKRYLPNWQNAVVKFVPAGKTLDDQIVDSDAHILHVDTGLGMLDHHQSNEDTCAAKKVYEFLRAKISKDKEWQNETLERMADVVNFYDHFRECNLPDAAADYQIFQTADVIDGLKSLYPEDDQKIVGAGFVMLDAIYRVMHEKIQAEEVLETEGEEFKTRWGKAIAFETLNDAVLKLSQKHGYMVSIRKDPRKDYIRIKGRPNTKVDLTQAYEILKEKDKQATWYLHPSKKILLNGTTKNPDMRPTKLTLAQVVAVFKKL